MAEVLQDKERLQQELQNFETMKHEMLDQMAREQHQPQELFEQKLKEATLRIEGQALTKALSGTEADVYVDAVEPPG